MHKAWLKKKDKIILEICKRDFLDPNDPRYFKENPKEQQKVIAMIEEYNRWVKHEAECSVMD